MYCLGQKEGICFYYNLLTSPRPTRSCLITPQQNSCQCEPFNIIDNEY